MDAETALELVKKGATLLVLDVPQNTLFGIDTQVLKCSVIFWCASAFASPLCFSGW